MPGITNPAEEFFKDGLWAWDVAEGRWLKLENDPTDNSLKVAVTNDAEVHQIAPGDLRVGAHGWIGGAWYKLPMVWGYSAHWAEQKKNSNAAVDWDTLYSTAVPAGEVWILEHMEGFDETTNIGIIYLDVESGGIVYHLQETPVTLVNQKVMWSGHITLHEGDKARLGFAGTVAGDDIYAQFWGSKMLIAE